MGRVGSWCGGRIALYRSLGTLKRQSGCERDRRTPESIGRLGMEYDGHGWVESVKLVEGVMEKPWELGSGQEGMEQAGEEQLGSGQGSLMRCGSASKEVGKATSREHGCQDARRQRMWPRHRRGMKCEDTGPAMSFAPPLLAREGSPLLGWDDLLLEAKLRGGDMISPPPVRAAFSRVRGWSARMLESDVTTSWSQEVPRLEIGRAHV